MFWKKYLILFLLFCFCGSENSAPKIIFNNCPEDEVVENNFELSWEIIAGDSDINYVFIVLNKDGEYYSRVFFEKELNDEIFPFPIANTSREFTQFVDNSGNKGFTTFDINFSISDEKQLSAENTCQIIFNN